MHVDIYLLEYKHTHAPFHVHADTKDEAHGSKSVKMLDDGNVYLNERFVRFLYVAAGAACYAFVLYCVLFCQFICLRLSSIEWQNKQLFARRQFVLTIN